MGIRLARGPPAWGRGACGVGGERTCSATFRQNSVAALSATMNVQPGTCGPRPLDRHTIIGAPSKPTTVCAPAASAVHCPASPHSATISSAAGPRIVNILHRTVNFPRVRPPHIACCHGMTTAEMVWMRLV